MCLLSREDDPRDAGRTNNPGATIAGFVSDVEGGAFAEAASAGVENRIDLGVNGDATTLAGVVAGSRSDFMNAESASRTCAGGETAGFSGRSSVVTLPQVSVISIDNDRADSTSSTVRTSRSSTGLHQEIGVPVGTRIRFTKGLCHRVVFLRSAVSGRGLSIHSGSHYEYPT